MAVTEATVTRAALKAALETKYPKFITALEEAVDKISTEDMFQSINLRQTAETGESPISSSEAQWLANVYGYETVGGITGNLTITVSPE